MNEFHASDTVGGYRLEARLGGGGFGTVWRARRTADNLLVALKLLPDTTGSDDLRLRADAELLAASAAGASPHVVRVLDGGVDPVPFVVMEFIYGISLAEELRQRQRLPQQEVIEIGLAIADALRAINAAGIVHRDVKPSNVMIDRNGVVKLTDFGIAKIAGFDAVTLTGQLPLSIAYAAPEVWEGRAEHRSDLYALAIVLYQCLTGALPFRGAYAELFYQHRNKEPDLSAFSPETAPTLIELIRTCLEKTPSDRPLDAEACIDMLHQAAGEVATPVVQALAQAREPERFGPWLKEEPVAGLPWAWYCRHETSAEEAIVELYFAESIAFGEALRRAVASNDSMAARGGERLLGSNRLILRPTESWPNQPAGAFQFWVAREARNLPRPPVQVSPRIALRVVESLLGLVEAADEEGLPLNLDPRELVLLPDDVLYLMHPGFPSPGRDEPERQALTYLRSLPLSREVRASLNRVASLDDARRALAMLTSVRDLTTPRPMDAAPELTAPEPYVDPHPRYDEASYREASEPRQRSLPPWAALAAGAVVAGVAVLVAAVLLSGHKSDSSKALSPPVASATVAPIPPNPVFAACMALPEPSPISMAEAACGDVGTYAFDPTCPRGQACNRKATAGKVSWAMNDRSVVYIDASGNLAVAREDGSDPIVLPNTARAQQPAWSPDGRYLAYLVVTPLEVTPAPPPSPASTPQPGQPPPPQGPFFSTQLQVMEVDRPANRGVVIATSSAPGVPSYLQRYATWPQWSPDGKTLYFLSIPANQPGGALYAIPLPTRGINDIDFGQLRSALMPSETTLPSKLQTVALSSADFGQSQASIGRFSVLASGEIYLQLCEGDRARPSCGLARYNGRPSTALIAGIVRDRIVDPPVAGTDGLYSYVREPSGAADPLKITPDAAPAMTQDIRLQPPADPANGAWFASAPELAVTRHGDALLAASATTAPSLLSGIRIADGAASPWRAGSSPVWYVASAPPPAIASAPPSQPFTTPSPEPTPTVTATPTPPRVVVRTMSLSLTVRRGNNVLPAATVVVLAGADECARGTTDALGRVTLILPRDGAPASCSQPDTRYRFVVDGMLVEQTVAYNPQSVSSFDITIP